MEFIEKETGNNSYRLWLEKRCARDGHEFMLRFSPAGAFYECAECGKRITVATMKKAIDHGVHNHEFAKNVSGGSYFYECAECGMRISEEAMKEACLN